MKPKRRVPPRIPSARRYSLSGYRLLILNDNQTLNLLKALFYSISGSAPATRFATGIPMRLISVCTLWRGEGRLLQRCEGLWDVQGQQHPGNNRSPGMRVSGEHPDMGSDPFPRNSPPEIRCGNFVGVAGRSKLFGALDFFDDHRFCRDVLERPCG
jgi:hypothetical protein